ncbi:MAG: geranylgeranylglyceryl/heptaprenylglyceryl phosphate synthase [Candidatus Marsarchaeota archaeon]|jgi:phosphoglycerol geranylgeranyltransferase|nr:geranylgeranylglyceryl/heptaprenylglyceryl phosphate synthase [Candidatus Marsarchaeota archaeon]
MNIKKGKVEKYIDEILESKGAMLFSLIDPVDYKSWDDVVSTAKAVDKGGADVLLIGGSSGVQGSMLDEVTKAIKESISIPIVLFPGNVATITKYADAIYFQSLLNSRNSYWHAQVQMLGAPVIKMAGIEPLPVGYILVSPGGTAGWVGDANLVPREKPKIAAALALTGQYLGNRLIVTDTGSNPRLQGEGPIPPNMIKAVKSTIDVPYIVGGGIISEKELRLAYKSGADVVQIGTAFEDHHNMSLVLKKAKLFSRITKEEGLRKVKK